MHFRPINNIVHHPHHVLCASLSPSSLPDTYRVFTSSSSSSTGTITVNSSFLLYRHHSSSNRRSCQYPSRYSNHNVKHHFCRRAKADHLDDDDYPTQPFMNTSSLPQPPEPPPSSPHINVVQKQQDPAIIIPGAPDDDDDDDDDDQSPQLLQLANSPILSACLIGLFTGLAVVLFNYTVHEIRDLSWGEIPNLGASWLREESIEAKWRRVILVPASGGLVVSLINMIRTAVEDDSADGTVLSNIRSTLKPILKTVAACVTLGTGNSLGPEGPSVEIGVSVAKGVCKVLDKGARRKLSLRAAGSAAGISSVLWPSPAESSLSLTNTTSMVILSAVIASVMSEIGLGSEPAFAVPVYDFRSPSELPLYLLLGVLCGLVSVGLSKSTSFMLVVFDRIQRVGIPRAVFPILGGLSVGLIALAYPEILYWGFQNVDTLLESLPFANSLSADLLLQLVAVKIVATSLCRASGLVGGYYAPSLFIGGATGMAYGKIVGHLISESNPIFHLSILEVASPQAYGLVGMAATLAGVCQVPLTAVLLLFELTQDYRIVLPLLGAVGLSSWITSDKTRKRATDDTSELKNGNNAIATSRGYSYDLRVNSTSSDTNELNGNSICELESSLCLNDDSDDDADYLANEILVSEAMKTKYVKALMSTSLTDVVSLMLEEQQSCAVIVDDNNQLVGQLTISDIQQFIELSRAKGRKPQSFFCAICPVWKFSNDLDAWDFGQQVLRVSELCSSFGARCSVSWIATPNMSLFSARSLMNRHGIRQLPVITEDANSGGCPVGLLDRESIDLACR
ncbi:UNVERIFIED_CONTAM: Chloride channel protein CLC-e [Sesamum latifolium]|uniref:Chloride channel protein n=1 Tax=Sesamum latifolium TaxID=2727402 RepID=A0AAW2XLX4_9LAMI